jgi:hypothetical protein
VVRLHRVVTCITSGVYEWVHSISRRTLYYITPPRFLRGLSPNKSYILSGGGGYLFEYYSVFETMFLSLVPKGKARTFCVLIRIKRGWHRWPENGLMPEHSNIM